jgi:protein ImuB
LLRRCHALGYFAQAAIASERFSARALARHGTRRVRVVSSGESLLALAELPLLALDGKEAVLREMLGALGFKRLGELAALPAGSVTARLGALGLQAHRLARGEDDSRFTPAPLEVELKESMQLEFGAESLEPVLFALRTVLVRLCARLQGRKQAIVRLGLSLQLESADASPQLSIALARPSAQVKLLLDLLRPSLDALRLTSPVIALSVAAEQVSEDRAQQQTLGEGPQGDAALEVVMARLTTTLGVPSVGAAELRDAHRPESAYGIRPFRPPPSASGLLGELSQQREAIPDAPEEASSRPTRMLPAPARLDAEVDEGGRPMFVRLWGQRRRVVQVAGPERLAGSWWGTERYRRDYYRVHCEGVGAVWLFRDADDGQYYLQGLFD